MGTLGWLSSHPVQSTRFLGSLLTYTIRCASRRNAAHAVSLLLLLALPFGGLKDDQGNHKIVCLFQKFPFGPDLRKKGFLLFDVQRKRESSPSTVLWCALSLLTRGPCARRKSRQSETGEELCSSSFQPRIMAIICQGNSS